jgi:hypothetical protein
MWLIRKLWVNGVGLVVTGWRMVPGCRYVIEFV